MTDDRRRGTTSDDLVRAAREQTHGDATTLEECSPSSPADSYRRDGMPDDHGGFEEEDSSLTAEEIAGILAESAKDRGAVAGEVVPSEPARSEPEPAPVATSWPPSPVVTVAGSVDPAPDVDRVAGRTAQTLAPPDHADTSTADFVGDRWSTSTREWEEMVARRPAKPSRVSVPRLPGVRAMVGLAILGFVGLGLVVSWFDGRQAIDELDVGACFTVGETEDVYDVPVVDCTEPHDSELFALVPVVGFGESHPGDDALFTWLFDRCLERFPGYVGEPYESSDYWIDMLIPTPDGWGQGDRIGMCTAVVVDDDLNRRPSTGSAKGAATTA